MTSQFSTNAADSARLKRVKLKNTAPEMAVRAALRKLNLRFRYGKGLPGTPDFVLVDYDVALFIHGCFWHRHPGCKKTTNPIRNGNLWAAKFEKNQIRDKVNCRRLRNAGWSVWTIWECQAGTREQAITQIRLRLSRHRGRGRVDALPSHA